MIEIIGGVALFALLMGLIFSGNSAVNREMATRGLYKPNPPGKGRQPLKNPPRPPEGPGAAHNKDV